MRSDVVRVAPSLIAACAFVGLAACTDSHDPTGSLAASQQTLRASTATLPLADATVHVISALDGLDATAINRSDEVVGGRGAYFFGKPPFRWSRRTGLEMLPTNGAVDAGAFGVNDEGDVVGYIVTANDTKHAVVWLRNSAMHVFQMPADSATDSSAVDCIGEGINDHGEVVGRCGVNFILRKAVIFHWNGPADDSPDKLVSDANLISVSNDGWIGGASDQSDINHGPFLISPTGTLVDLLDHSGVISPLGAVIGVTLRGQAAGVDWQGATGTCPLAVAWLGTWGQNQPFPEVLMGTPGEAFGVTADQVVAGIGGDCALSDSSLFAFAWSPDNGLEPLPGLGRPKETSGAIGINARHHVLGSIASGGVAHTVIWYLHREENQGNGGPTLAGVSTP